MGSVGSGVAGEQEFAMKSVGTRTTLPRGPPLSRRGPSERLHAAPCTSEGSSDERGGSSTTMDRGQLTIAASRLSRGSRLEGNAAGRRDTTRVSLDACGNMVGHGVEKNHEVKGRDGNNGKRDSRMPPKILTVSGKLEQNNSTLVRPSAFKPVVPKSFHSMQNLVGQSSGGRSAGSDAPQSLCEQDSPDRDPSAGNDGQGGMSDSGRNSLTSLPTYTGPGVSYGPARALGPLSASTSHINRLSSTAAPLEKPDKPSYQNGLSVSDSGQSSSGKSCLSYQRLATIQPSPSTDDIIQDLEDRLWEKEQEVIHMRRNLDQSEAAIAQVFEEKQRVWERDMEELRQNYARRLQQVTHRAQRTQQALQTHIARLQQDKGRLQDEISALLAQREELEHKCLDYRKEQADILPRLEETKWELCQKAGEISLLKQQLRESQNEVTQRAGEMVALRGQLKELKGQMKEREETMIGLKDSYTNKSRELERCEGELKRTLTEVSMLRDKLVVFEAEVLGLKRALSELSCRSDHAVCLRDISGISGSLPWAGLHSPRTPEALPIDSFLSLQSDEAKAQRQEAGELRRQLERLQGELHLERQQRERQVLTFAQERHTWKGEKERVLKYQAQLQLSYVETLQRNQALEERVGQLGAKLGISPGSPVSLSIPVPVTITLSPAADDPKHLLAPPWPGPSRLERIESTEI
ncbi:leucine zipper putative tumor suppressor 3 isoform X1 [Sinocyclocheilus grahami]|uniref:leucine zipper putative tumor suppressor 3 isoform X1 n=1 Tax=Sinocyclocheilus grahami TaxID=75366 RepID=UPI0007AD0EFA|nr:PREDICTED: leucine zipper putative tumor suppressor 3 isoform X1 [Sinocyclocheilus grahami]XP_016109440.1 PREDICTED: leucine zipper putative tumor suppressor 3 isoform X1 [Sinocyclocheilus grahami]